MKRYEDIQLKNLTIPLCDIRSQVCEENCIKNLTIPLYDIRSQVCEKNCIKNLTIPICDIRSKVCEESIFSEMSPISSASWMSLMKGEKNALDVPIDDLACAMKRKRWQNEEEVQRNVKEQIVKIIPSRKCKKNIRYEEPSDCEAEENEDSDSDYEIHKSEGSSDLEAEEENDFVSDSETTKNMKQKENPKNKTSGLSAYEKMIEEKRAERMAFLQSIKIDEVKAGFAEIVAKVKKPPVKRVFKKVKSAQPVRKSRRLANLDIDFSEDSLFVKKSEKMKDIIIPPELSFKEALDSNEPYEDCIKDFTVLESITEQKFLSYDKFVLKSLSLETFNVAKVVPESITALAWYPSVDHLMVSAGDTDGNFSLWNVDSKSNSYLFKNHARGITNLQFSPFTPAQLISSSYDGTLRCCDFVKHMFNEIYNVSDVTGCTYFDFLTPKVVLVSHLNGQIALVDRRSEGKKCEKRHTVHDYSVKSVNVHPVNKNYFITASNKGSIRLWDLRKLQETPVVELNQHKWRVNSAFFSPVTGNSILTTSIDNSICIFDSTDLTGDIKLRRRIKHDNSSWQQLSLCRAMWLPNSDEAFAVSCLDMHPRRIQIFDKDMNEYYSIMHDNLTTITSTNAFHPLRAAIAGGNSSGKLYVFT